MIVETYLRFSPCNFPQSAKSRFASPARFGHVEAVLLSGSAAPERSSFATVVADGFTFVADEEPAIRMHYPPPRHAAAP